MMSFLNPAQNLIVPNVSWGIANLHECDLLMLSQAGYATEIEIKVSKSDILADKRKKHGHRHNYIRRLFFAVPYDLEAYALNHIPERSGLYVIKPDMECKAPESVRLAKKSVIDKNAHRWTDEERMQLSRLGNLRILGLKKKIFKQSIITTHVITGDGDGI